VLSDTDLESDEELWTGDDDGDHGGWFCVRTIVPCPADGCPFVADFMTAAHLVLVGGARRSEPPGMRSGPEVGRNPRIVGYEERVRAERVVLRVGSCWPARARREAIAGAGRLPTSSR
jgi:hypothetical protein